MVGVATSSGSMHSLLEGNAQRVRGRWAPGSTLTHGCICAHGGGSKVLIALDRRRCKERRRLLHLLHEEGQQLADALPDALAPCAARLDHEKEKVSIEIEQQRRFLGIHLLEGGHRVSVLRLGTLVGMVITPAYGYHPRIWLSPPHDSGMVITSGLRLGWYFYHPRTPVVWLSPPVCALVGMVITPHARGMVLSPPVCALVGMVITPARPWYVVVITPPPVCAPWLVWLSPQPAGVVVRDEKADKEQSSGPRQTDSVMRGAKTGRLQNVVSF